MTTAKTVVVAAIAVGAAAVTMFGFEAASPAAPAAAPATISLDSFDYDYGSLNLATSYVMGSSPQVTNPQFGASPTPNYGQNALRVNILPASAVSFRAAFTLSRYDLSRTVSTPVGSVGLALRSDGATTHAWSVSVVVTTSDGKKYISSDTAFAVNQTAWTKKAIPFPTTIPSGAKITSWQITPSVDDDSSASRTDGSHLFIDALSA